MSDRQIHATLRDGREVVRYDRAGKWFVEGQHGRRAVSVLEAAQTAIQYAGEIHYGLPGGSRFDSAVRRV